jgi:hypothetical protein
VTGAKSRTIHIGLITFCYPGSATDCFHWQQQVVGCPNNTAKSSVFNSMQRSSGPGHEATETFLMTVRVRLASVPLGVRTVDLEVRSPAVPVKEFAHCVCKALGLHTETEVAVLLSEAPNLLRWDETLAGVSRRTGIMDIEIAVLEAGGAVDEEDATSIESRARLDMLLSQVGEVEREMKRLIFTVADSRKQAAKASIAQHGGEDIEGLRRRLEESEERVLQLEEQLHHKVIRFIQTEKVMWPGKPFVSVLNPGFLGLNPAAAGVR